MIRKAHKFIVRKCFVLPNGTKTKKGDILTAYCKPFVAGNSEPIEYFRLELTDDNNIVRIPAANVRFHEVEISHGS